MMNKEISKIKPDKNQPRKSFDFEKLKEMSETFKTQGTIQPIEIDENYIIITGELRWRAAKMAGLKTIPVKILKNLSKEARLERQLVENFNRQDMRLVDSIDAVKRFMRNMGRPSHNLHGNDKLIEETATRLGISRKWLSQNLKFDGEAPTELKEAVKEKKMSVSQAVEIMNLPDEKDRKIITEEILKQEKKPDHRKIRERVREIKKEREQEEIEAQLEEKRKLSKKEIRIITDREKALVMRKEIIETQSHFNRLMSNVRWASKKKFFFEKPKQRDDFIRFLNGAAERARKWADELDSLREHVEIEVLRE